MVFMHNPTNKQMNKQSEEHSSLAGVTRFCLYALQRVCSRGEFDGDMSRLSSSVNHAPGCRSRWPTEQRANCRPDGRHGQADIVCLLREGVVYYVLRLKAVEPMKEFKKYLRN